MAGDAALAYGILATSPSHGRHQAGAGGFGTQAWQASANMGLQSMLPQGAPDARGLRQGPQPADWGGFGSQPTWSSLTPAARNAQLAQANAQIQNAMPANVKAQAAAQLMQSSAQIAAQQSTALGAGGDQQVLQVIAVPVGASPPMAAYSAGPESAMGVMGGGQVQPMQVIAVPAGMAPPAGAIPAGPGGAPLGLLPTSTPPLHEPPAMQPPPVEPMPRSEPQRSSRYQIIDPKTGREVEAPGGNGKRKGLRIVNPKTGEEVLPKGEKIMEGRRASERKAGELGAMPEVPVPAG